MFMMYMSVCMLALAQAKTNTIPASKCVLWHTCLELDCQTTNVKPAISLLEGCTGVKAVPIEPHNCIKLTMKLLKCIRVTPDNEP